MTISNVIQCPSCGTVQVSQAVKVFKCNRCNKSKTINPSGKFGLGVKVLASFDHPLHAAAFVQEYQKRRYEKEEE